MLPMGFGYVEGVTHDRTCFKALFEGFLGAAEGA